MILGEFLASKGLAQFRNVPSTREGYAHRHLLLQRRPRRGRSQRRRAPAGASRREGRRHLRLEAGDERRGRRRRRGARHRFGGVCVRARELRQPRHDRPHRRSCRRRSAPTTRSITASAASCRGRARTTPRSSSPPTTATARPWSTSTATRDTAHTETNPGAVHRRRPALSRAHRLLPTATCATWRRRCWRSWACRNLRKWKATRLSGIFFAAPTQLLLRA